MGKIDKILGKKLLSNEEIIKLQTEGKTYIDQHLIAIRKRILFAVSKLHSYNPHLELKLQNDIEQLFTHFELSSKNFIDVLSIVIRIYRLLHWIDIKNRLALTVSLYVSIQFDIEL